jgi:hypothetical protein
MSGKTAAPAKAPRPAAKRSKAQDKGVIALKGPGGLPRTGKRRTAAPAETPIVTVPAASELKALRLERIKQRARAGRPPEPPPVVAPEIEPPVAELAAEPPVAEGRAASELLPEPPVAELAAEPPVAELPPEPPVAVLEVAPSIVEPEAPPVVPPAAEPGAPPAAIVELIQAMPTAITAPPPRPTWSPPPRPRRSRTAVGLLVRAVSTLLRWGLRR